LAVNVRGGLDLKFEGSPRQEIAGGPAITSVAALGVDYPDMRFDVLVEEKAQVKAGQALMRHRGHPDRAVVAPVSGQIVTVARGARRLVDRIEIAVEGDDSLDFPRPPSLDRDGLRSLLLASGLWAALRARPFGRPADLAGMPGALFITAMDSRPHAPDPAVVIAAHPEWFQRGLRAIALLTEGKTFLCHAAGAAVPVLEGIAASAFAGRHPAGLPTTHIHHLHPVARAGATAWHIGYQDVIALGHLLDTGRLWTERVVSVSGPAVTSPTLLRTRPGARLHSLLQGRLVAPGVSLLSGSPLEGREQEFLSRDHLQVFAVPNRPQNGLATWPSLLLEKRFDLRPNAVIPNAVHEMAAPAGVLPIPLMRALSVSDAEMARRLGALELVEEDLALLSSVDAGGTDFGRLLRVVLNELEGSQ
jgi:Na+-transporting NADH:ubiquinone oxidoreductase subunit A